MFAQKKNEEFMRKRKIILVALLAGCLVVSLAGCTTFDNFKSTFFEDKGSKADTIKIGILEPTTGSDSDAGELEINGIKLAHKLHPTVNGKKVELITEDTQSSLYTAESAVQALIDKKPAAILGTYGNACSLAASKYIEKAEIPAITMTATNPLITSNNPYYFRVNFSEASQGFGIADYIGKQLHQKNAVIVTVENDDTVDDVVNNFTKELTSASGNKNCITDELVIKQDLSNLDDVVAQLKSLNVKTIFAPVPIETAGQLFEAVTKAKLTGLTVVGTKDWHTQKLLGLQSQYKGISIAVASDANVTNANTQYYDEFVNAYKKKYGSSKPDQATALAFDAYMLAIQAIQTAGTTDGVQVRNALAQIKNYSGASGIITFDNSGNPKKSVNIDVIKKGAYLTVYTVN